MDNKDRPGSSHWWEFSVYSPQATLVVIDTNMLYAFNVSTASINLSQESNFIPKWLGPTQLNLISLPFLGQRTVGPKAGQTSLFWINQCLEHQGPLFLDQG